MDELDTAMNQKSLPIQALCDVAIQAAREAGQFIQGIDRSKLKTSFKDAGSSKASQLVTEVDIGSEAIIREHLRASSAQWDIAFVGEESEGDSPGVSPERLVKPYHWCVDPLDGTLPYIESGFGYAVSIALVDRAGVPLIGVVYDPVTDSLLHAIAGQGAYRDQALIGRPTATSASLLVFADASFTKHERYTDVLNILGGYAQQAGLAGVELVRGSGAVKNASQVLDYPAACYIKLPKPEDGGGSIWDFAATACIVKEAGGWVSDIHGLPLALNSPGSTFMNHHGVMYVSGEQMAQHIIKSLQACA